VRWRSWARDDADADAKMPEGGRTSMSIEASLERAAVLIAEAGSKKTYFAKFHRLAEASCVAFFDPAQWCPWDGSCNLTV
jgi:hypothetical protein